jgi:hypothetical protein
VVESIDTPFAQTVTESCCGEGLVEEQLPGGAEIPTIETV